MKLKNTMTKEFKNGIKVEVGFFMDEKGNIFVDLGEYENPISGKKKCLAQINNRQHSVNRHDNLYYKIKKLLEGYNKPTI